MPESNAAADTDLATAATAVAEIDAELHDTPTEPQAAIASEAVVSIHPRFSSLSNRTLVSAADLPPAADTLATLFAEEPAAFQEIASEESTVAEVSVSSHSDELESVAADSESSAVDEDSPEISAADDAELAPAAEPNPTAELNSAADLTSEVDQPSAETSVSVSVSVADSTSSDDRTSQVDSTLDEMPPESSSETVSLDSPSVPAVDELVSLASTENAEAIPEENQQTILEEVSQTAEETKADDDFGDYSFSTTPGVV